MTQLTQLMIGGDVTRARKRMRNAWIAGFVAAAINLIVALITFSGVDSEGNELIGRSEFVFVVIESALLAGLSYGVIQRYRPSAVLLFVYFLLSKSIAIGLGWLNPSSLPIQLLFLYLFFQGMRGAISFHYFTHPDYRVINQPQEEAAERD